MQLAVAPEVPPQPDGRTLVTIGLGPYPDRGVGIEAGDYTGYFARRRVIGVNAALPNAKDTNALAQAVLENKADAVLVWGTPADPAYRGSRDAQSVKVTDPSRGEFATIVLREPRTSQLVPPAHSRRNPPCHILQGARDPIPDKTRQPFLETTS